MFILGLNGWINGSHDASAALFCDGGLIACAEEERLTRRKHALDQLPHNAIDACLAVAGITAGDLDCVAIGWDLAARFAADRGRPWRRLSDAEILGLFLPLARFPERQGRSPLVLTFPHHEAHAAAAFYASPFARAAAFVLDGVGEFDSGMIAICDRLSGIVPVRRFGIRQSLGVFFEALTAHLGFPRFGEGRAMGLAAYGGDGLEIEQDIDWDDPAPPWGTPGGATDTEIFETWRAAFERVCGSAGYKPCWRHDPLAARRQASLEIQATQCDLAAAGQRWLERQLQSLIPHGLTDAGTGNIVLAGGVALNCQANAMLCRQPGVSGVYVTPAPGDAGVALGAACLACAQLDAPPRLDDSHVFAGPGFAPAKVEREFDRIGIAYEIVSEPAKAVAEAIAAGKVVALCRGGWEFGPRALGHRSILADPRSTAMRDRVNLIKQRESWRPLAPSILAECAEQWFELPTLSPFMSFTAAARDVTRTASPGILHQDGSARLQTVTANSANGLFHSIISEFSDLTDVPMVLNTSFNIGNEPVVATPADAVRSFAASPLDVLLVENCLVRKRSAAA